MRRHSKTIETDQGWRTSCIVLSLQTRRPLQMSPSDKRHPCLIRLSINTTNTMNRYRFTIKVLLLLILFWQRHWNRFLTLLLNQTEVLLWSSSETGQEGATLTIRMEGMSGIQSTIHPHITSTITSNILMAMLTITISLMVRKLFRLYWVIGRGKKSKKSDDVLLFSKLSSIIVIIVLANKRQNIKMKVLVSNKCSVRLLAWKELVFVFRELSLCSKSVS